MKSRRPQTKIIRVLTLLHTMAGLFTPMTSTELLTEMNGLYGSKRTLYRDLELLIELGMVVEDGSRTNDGVGGIGAESTLYVANVPRAKRLQLIAAERLVRGTSDEALK